MGPAHEAVLSGEVWISLVMNTYRALEGKFNDIDPIEVLWPEEGTIERRSPIGISAGAPNPNAAKVFFDWVTSKEGQIVIQPSFFFSNHKEVPTYKGVERVKKFMAYSETEMANADKRKYFDIFERLFHKK
jgi:ABC-type Fe3+ transport system substrate-binding protein